MAKGIIGQPFTFTVLFVDSNGDPIVPTTPTIEVFYFDNTGAKQVLVAAGTALTAVVGDTGRYAHTITIPGALTPADEIYGVMKGTEPDTGQEIVVEQEVDPFEPGSGKIEIEDEGVSLGSFTVVNFIGADVEVLDVGGVATVYIPPLPPPSYSSHWNTADGDNGNQAVTESISRSTAHVSTPSGGEGTPFKTGGWADTNQAASLQTAATFTTPGDTTGFGGDSTAVVTMYDADGVSVLETYTTPVLTANATHTSGSGNIVVTISSYGIDDTFHPARQKANMSVAVAAGTILTAAGLQGGRYHCTVVMTPDSTTDGTGPYTYTQSAVFLDTNPTTPSISGTLTISETGGSVVTKELSGLSYYDLGSDFTVGITGIDQLNRNTSRTSQNVQITGSTYGLSTLNIGTGSLGAWNNNQNTDGATYAATAWDITSASYRQVSTNATVSAFPSDTWANGPTVFSAAVGIMIDTYGVSSTDSAEYFNDEDRRQDSGYNAGTPAGNWNSAQGLVAAEGLVYSSELLVPNQAPHTNWGLFNPGGPNYAALGAPVSYYRTFVDSAGSNRSAMTLNFAGTFLGDAAADLAAEDLKVFIRRRASAGGGGAGPAANPLRVHGALYNFATFDDGATIAGSYIREGTSSGNTINVTFGGFSCENGIFIEIQIANAGIKLDSVLVSFI